MKLSIGESNYIGNVISCNTISKMDSVNNKISYCKSSSIFLTERMNAVTLIGSEKRLFHNLYWLHFCMLCYVTYNTMVYTISQFKNDYMDSITGYTMPYSTPYWDLELFWLLQLSMPLEALHSHINNNIINTAIYTCHDYPVYK